MYLRSRLVLNQNEGVFMCDSNNITIGGSNFPPVVKERNSKIKFETSFIPPVDYKFCNKPGEENKSVSSCSQTIVGKKKEEKRRTGTFVNKPW